LPFGHVAEKKKKKIRARFEDTLSSS
jgi:hypothetical protein